MTKFGRKCWLGAPNLKEVRPRTYKFVLYIASPFIKPPRPLLSSTPSAPIRLPVHPLPPHLRPPSSPPYALILPPPRSALLVPPIASVRPILRPLPLPPTSHVHPRPPLTALVRFPGPPSVRLGRPRPDCELPCPSLHPIPCTSPWSASQSIPKRLLFAPVHPKLLLKNNKTNPKGQNIC